MKLEVSLEKRLGDFTLKAGFATRADRVGIFGRSGSGKSTLVHLLAGLIPPDRGHIELDGELLYSSARRICLSPERRRIAVVFQHAHLFPHMNARRNLLYGYRRTPVAQRKIDPETLIEVLDLGALLDRRVPSLSGGERQRVALGRAVLANPRLLVMDEPLSALDESLKYQIIPYLTAVGKEFRLPTLLISHSINEIRLMTDEVIVMHEGGVLEQTSPEQLARKQMGRTQAGYVNLLHLSDPVDEDGLFAYRWNGVRLLLGAGLPGPALFELLAKDIVLLRGRPEAISARNLLRCRVVNLFELDGRVGVELACGGERLIAQVMKQAIEELNIRPGEEIHAVIKSSAFRRLY